MLQTTLMILQQCTESKQAFNSLVKIEQNLSISKSIEESPLIATQGKKIDVISQIIRVIDFFLTVTGKELEDYQIQILAGDLYEKFRTDTLDDIVLMFKMARMGDFGKVYKCDSFEIMNWANQYMDIKSATREKLLKKASTQPSPKEREPSGKFFSELPAEFKEKWNKIGKYNKQQFLNPKITEMMTNEKKRRAISKSIQNE